jgi:hypothetical protein
LRTGGDPLNRPVALSLSAKDQIMRLKHFLNRFSRHLNPAREAPRPKKSSTRLNLEAMEDRLVPTTVRQVGPVLTITATPNDTIVMREDPLNHSLLDVSDKTGLLGQFVISSIHTVNVSVAGSDAIKMDDTNGIPFANGTVIALSGTGTKNALDLVGGTKLTDNETFNAGTAGGVGSVGVDGADFTFTSAIESVTDDLSVTKLTVEAQGPSVTLKGNGGSETLEGLAGTGGGGNNLTYHGKADTTLELRNANATANLDAAAGALGLTEFDVLLDNSLDQVNINATPASVTTHVLVTAALNQETFVTLFGNAGPVDINGNGVTTVALESTGLENTSVTSGINNNVFVEGVDFLDLSDGGNATTPENVTVTESTISGTGLFGNNSVVLTYEAVNNLMILTGRLVENYTVTGSHPGATFGAQVNIDNNNNGSGALNIRVNLDSGSGLSLFSDNNSPAESSLVFSAPPTAIFSPPPGMIPMGTETITFPGVPGALTSTVTYSGYDSVTSV